MESMKSEEYYQIVRILFRLSADEGNHRVAEARTNA